MTSRLPRIDPRLWAWLVPAAACLAVGGVRSWTVGVVALACGLGTMRGHRPRLGVPEGLVLGALALQLAQLVPLPIGVLGWIDPATAAIVQDTWEAAGRPLAWHCLSLAPGDTAAASGQLALFALALTLARREVASGRKDELIEGAILAATAVVVVVGLHTALGLDTIYGVVDAPGRGISFVLGPFLNSNHLAVFCGVALPVVAAWTVGRSTPQTRWMGAVLAVALVGIAVATLSRTAILGLGVGLGVFVALVAAAGQLKVRALAMAGGALLAGVVAGILGTRGRARGLGDVGALSDFSSRTDVWAVAVDVTKDHPWFGIGAGAFHSLWWAVRPGPTETAAQDVESVFFQTLVSLGFPGTLALGVGAVVVLVMAARVAWRRLYEGDLTGAGALAGLCALLAMDGVTLATSQPGLSVLGAWLLGSLASGHRHRGPRLPRPLAAALALGACALLIWGAPRTLRNTDRLYAGGNVEAPVDLALRHPADPYGLAWAAEQQVRQPNGRGLELLNRAMMLDPHGAEPHRVAVNVLLATGHRSQARIEARLALTGATRKELRLFVQDALDLWPELDDRLALLPAAPDRALRVAEELARLGDPELAVEVWLELGTRLPAVPGSLARGLQRLPGERREEGLALAEQALRDTPEDTPLRLARIRLLRLDGQTDRAEAALQELMDHAELSDVYRTAALGQLARMHADEPDVLRQLLGRPAGTSVAERAIRAWMQGRVFEADGALSKAVREYATATRLRPDVLFFQTELASFRARVAEAVEE